MPVFKNIEFVQPFLEDEDAPGRPPFEIDLKVVFALAHLQLTDEQMAAKLGCSRATITRAKRTPEYMAALNRGKYSGQVNIIERQFDAMNGGDRTMLVWLGKQYCSQTDKTDTRNTDSITMNVNFGLKDGDGQDTDCTDTGTADIDTAQSE